MRSCGSSAPPSSRTCAAGPGGSSPRAARSARGPRTTRDTGHGWLPDWWRSCGRTTSRCTLESTRHLTSDHPYKTNPWSLAHPGPADVVLLRGPEEGRTTGCLVDQCSKAITSIGTPSIWWGATLAIFVLLFMWALRRDWRAGAILAGLFAGYLPWFFLGDRTIYSFYEVAFVPYVVLACVYVLGLIIGGRERRRAGAGSGSASPARSCVLTIGALRVLLPDLHRRRSSRYSQWQRADVVPQLDLTRVSGRRPGRAAAGPAWSPARPAPPPAGSRPAARRTGTRRPSSRGG